MKAQTSTCCGVTMTRIFPGGVLASLGLAAVWAAVVLAAPPKERSPLGATPTEAVAKPDGRELFAREWIAGDPRSHGGDGLGPVFNDTSCVACHNQGGAGGVGNEISMPKSSTFPEKPGRMTNVSTPSLKNTYVCSSPTRTSDVLSFT